VERFYRAAVSPLIDDDEWQRLPLKLRRKLTRSTFALAVSDASRAVVHGGFDGDVAHISRNPVRLDETGAEQLAALLRRLLDDVARLERESAARGGDGVARELVVLCFDDLSPIVPA
jgi:hypothetical protein